MGNSTNNCGTSFHDAGLKLVAGDVNIVQKHFQNQLYRKEMMAMDYAAEYNLNKRIIRIQIIFHQRHTDVNDNETKQLVASGKNVTAQKYFYDGERKPKVGVYANLKW